MQKSFRFLHQFLDLALVLAPVFGRLLASILMQVRLIGSDNSTPPYVYSSMSMLLLGNTDDPKKLPIRGFKDRVVYCFWGEKQPL